MTFLLKQHTIRLTLFLALVLFPTSSLLEAKPEKTRLIIMADMGNETDEEQQMIHMLLYSNMFDLEGLIACSGFYLHSEVKNDTFRTKNHPELFTKIIDAYSHVLGNLQKHSDGWPSPDYLHSIVRSGTDVFGMKAVKEGQSNEASKFLEAAILKNDPRKLYIVANAGTNTLAQSLIDLDATHNEAQMKALCKKIIVFENGAQDNAGAWIAHKYPHISWHRSNRQTYCYGGPDYGKFGEAAGPYTWEPFDRDSDGQDAWATKHIKKDHGPLGSIYPYRNRFIEGGGTIPWMGLAFHGLTDPEKLYWGGHSGRFSRSKHKNIRSFRPAIRNDEESYDDYFMFDSDTESETWTDPVENEPFKGSEVPVWRFRRSMFNDFQARMDWCVNDYDKANHNPIAAFNGDMTNTIIHLKVTPGQDLNLDASATKDPDDDPVQFKWWIYQEAGTYDKPLTIKNPSAQKTKFTIPNDAAGKEIHIILEVQDKNDIVSMYDYRRIVVQVSNPTSESTTE